MPTESGITLPPDGTGKPTRTNTISTAYNAASHMPVYVLGDPNTSGNLAGIDSLGRLKVVDNQDVGRVPVVFSTAALAGVTAEALATFSINKGGTASSGTAYTVSTGKTFRVTTVSITARNTIAATGNGFSRIALRSAYTSAAPTATSPVFFITEVGGAQGVVQTSSVSQPDGLEFTSGVQIGITHIASAVTMLETITIIGFEY